LLILDNTFLSDGVISAHLFLDYLLISPAYSIQFIHQDAISRDRKVKLFKQEETMIFKLKDLRLKVAPQCNYKN
jgi:hypothetical protein